MNNEQKNTIRQSVGSMFDCESDMTYEVNNIDFKLKTTKSNNGIISPQIKREFTTKFYQVSDTDSVSDYLNNLNISVCWMLHNNCATTNDIITKLMNGGTFKYKTKLFKFDENNNLLCKIKSISYCCLDTWTKEKYINNSLNNLFNSCDDLIV